MSGSEWRADGQCRSDCSAKVTRRLVMLSESGRAWVATCCDDDQHLAEKYSVAADLGFHVQRIEAVAA